MHRRAIVIGPLCAAIVAAVLSVSTACASGKGKGAGASASPRTPAPSAAGGGRIGGPASGVSFALPAHWRQVDPTRDTSPVVAASFGLTGGTADLVRSLLEEQRKAGVLFAIDASVSSGFAAHLQAGCGSGGLTGSSLAELKAKTVALHPGARLTDRTVSGRPGFEARYSGTTNGGATAVDGLMLRVPVSDDRYCFLEMEGPRNGLPADAEQTASGWALA